MKKTLALAICIRAIVYTNCDYSFNQCGIFEKMVSFTIIPSLNQGLEQGKLLAAVISQIKVQKTWVLIFKIIWKDLLCTKM